MEVQVVHSHAGDTKLAISEIVLSLCDEARRRECQNRIKKLCRRLEPALVAFFTRRKS